MQTRRIVRGIPRWPDALQPRRRVFRVWCLAWRTALVVCCAAGIAGCPAAVSTQTPQQLQARLQSATLIGDDSTRDQALTSVAIDAAQSGNEQVCLAAAEQIEGDSLRDKTLKTCVKKIDRNLGKRGAAESLANLIGDDNARDQILSLLANSAPGASATNSGAPRR